MARRFERTRRGVTARLDDGERVLLAELFDEVAELLDDGMETSDDPLEALVALSPGAERPSDPALARLLPDAARDEPDQAAEFRRLTEHGLRARKRQALAVARATLDEPGPLRLDAQQAQAWLTAINDVRLVLAERLELHSDVDAEHLARAAQDPSSGDPRAWLASVYDFLTWMLETLVGALGDQLRHGQAAPPPSS
jgi:hypothetical protein